MHTTQARSLKSLANTCHKFQATKENGKKSLALIPTSESRPWQHLPWIWATLKSRAKRKGKMMCFFQHPFGNPPPQSKPIITLTKTIQILLRATTSKQISKQIACKYYLFELAFGNPPTKTTPTKTLKEVGQILRATTASKCISKQIACQWYVFDVALCKSPP